MFIESVEIEYQKKNYVIIHFSRNLVVQKSLRILILSKDEMKMHVPKKLLYSYFEISRNKRKKLQRILEYLM